MGHVDDVESIGIGDEQIPELQIARARIIERNDGFQLGLEGSIEVQDYEPSVCGHVNEMAA